MLDRPRTPEECQHRQVLPGPQDAWCRVVRDVTEMPDPLASRVARDACLACLASFPPSVSHLNPVVASLVYNLAGGELAVRDPTRASLLRERVAPFLAPEEDADPRAPQGPVPGRLDHFVPLPRQRSGPRVRTWAVGVTTAPREVPTLDACLERLESCGWDRPRLFIDGSETEVADRWRSLPRTVREPRLGAWPNYFLALSELVLRHPDADAYMLLQDDALFLDLPSLRSDLERALWPGSRPGVVSLFCSRAHDQPDPGWHRFEGHWIWCALAFVFAPEPARRFLADPDVVEHRRSTTRHGLADIDWLVGAWASSSDVPIHHPFPSLVQHIGDVSTLWPSARAFGFRRASGLAGDSAPGRGRA